MKVVLTSQIKGLGRPGDEKEVKPGYARNFLFPNKLAVNYDSYEGDKVRAVKEAKERKDEKETKQISEIIIKHQGMRLVFSQKASSEGKLFGSIGTKEIGDKAEEKLGIKISAVVPEKAIKIVGEHHISFLFRDGQKMNAVVEVKNSGSKK